VASTANVLAVDPLNVPPEVKYVPAVNAAAVAFAVVAVVAVVAVDALPVKAPTNVVEVTDDNPVKVVVAAAPNVNVCEPNDTEELARLALVIPAVPDRFEFVNPDIDPPKVIVPAPVIVPPVNVMPDTVPAVATEVTVPPPAVDVIVIAPDPEVIEIPEPAVKPASVIPEAVDPINTFPLSLLPPVNIAPAVTEYGAAFIANEAVAADVAVPDISPCNEPVIEVATILVAPNWPILGLYVNEATVPKASADAGLLLLSTNGM
jgi:hypothetical protein